MADEYSREPGELDPGMEEGEDRPIDLLSDIDITRINDLMFNSCDVKWCYVLSNNPLFEF